MAKNNIPRHVGFIPDGNRRWAMDHGIPKEAGYAHGINPGLVLYEKCKECGIKEISIYGFTHVGQSKCVPLVQVNVSHRTSAIGATMRTPACNLAFNALRSKSVPQRRTAAGAK
jgi:hypothetical protein